MFDNPQHLLWPNQFVKARLRLSTRKDALVMPAAVVQHGPQGTFAYVVNADSTVTNRPITLTAIQGDVAVVASGLKVGEQVVVDGQGQLRPGSRVATKPAPVPGASSAAASGSAAPRGSAARAAPSRSSWSPPPPRYRAPPR